MMTLRLALAYILVFSSFFSSQVSSEPIDDAIFFVLRLDGRCDDFFELWKPSAKNTEEYRLIANNMGEEKADRLFFLSFIDVQAPYRNQCERNLAESYLEVFSADELVSLTKTAKKSPYFAKYIDNRKSIGANASVRSQELIKTVASKSVELAFAKFNVAN